MKVPSIYREHAACLERIKELERGLQEMLQIAGTDDSANTTQDEARARIRDMAITARLALAGCDTYESERAALGEEK